MRRFLFLLISVTVCCINDGYAQDVPEPEFIGEAIIVDVDTKQYKRLPKERGIVRVVNFMGERTSRIVLSDASPFVISDKTNCAVIIKAENNSYDPMSVIQVFRFETNMSNQRVTELSRASSGGYFAQGESNRKQYVEFHAVKYGESSYLIKFPIFAGHYGIITGGVDESNLIIATFDVFDTAEKDAEDYYNRIATAKAQMAEREKLAKQQKKDAKKASKKQK
jgi:hypothetical protein